MEGAQRVTFVDLEFDTGTSGGAQLGDIASSLVSVDELLRDLGSIAEYSAGPAFRHVQIVAIEMRNPLKIKLSLVAISPEAVEAFQHICRDIILARSTPAASIEAALEICSRLGGRARITEQEAQRLQGHIVTLQNAEVPLKRVEVTGKDLL